MVEFSQIRRAGHLPDLIASEIMSQIDQGTLKPGDALPTETSLAESFGVSRNVIREATARLRSDGVIRTRQGSGALVLPLSQRATFRIDPGKLGESTRLGNLFELRGLLEIDAAGLAAERRTAAEISRMEAAIADMEGQGEFDEKRLEADAAFHRALGAATRNDYLVGIVDYISGRLKETTLATTKIYADGDLLEVTIGEHLRILDAIRAQDISGARRAMHDHISGAASRLGVAVPKFPKS